MDGWVGGKVAHRLLLLLLLLLLLPVLTILTILLGVISFMLEWISFIAFCPLCLGVRWSGYLPLLFESMVEWTVDGHPPLDVLAFAAGFL